MSDLISLQELNVDDDSNNYYRHANYYRYIVRNTEKGLISSITTVSKIHSVIFVVFCTVALSEKVAWSFICKDFSLWQMVWLFIDGMVAILGASFLIVIFKEAKKGFDDYIMLIMFTILWDISTLIFIYNKKNTWNITARVVLYVLKLMVNIFGWCFQRRRYEKIKGNDEPNNEEIDEEESQHTVDVL